MRGFALSAAALLVAAASAAAADSDGKQVFHRSCEGCHGAKGEGNPVIARIMKVTMRPLGSKEVQAKSDAELRRNVAQGTGRMKAMVLLTAEQVDEAVAYLRSLKK